MLLAMARDLLQQPREYASLQQELNRPAYDEAIQLSWYLSNIFYPVFGEILDTRASNSGGSRITFHRKLLSVGFWPGGDRDGNPYVTTDITRRVAEKLRSNVIACYHKDIS